MSGALSLHPDAALARAAEAAGLRWREHDAEFYDRVLADWRGSGAGRRHGRAWASAATSLSAVLGAPPLHVALVLRQIDADELAEALVRSARSRGAQSWEEQALLRALDDYVRHAARAGVRGDRLLGPVVAPLIAERRKRRRW